MCGEHNLRCVDFRTPYSLSLDDTRFSNIFLQRHRPIYMFVLCNNWPCLSMRFMMCYVLSYGCSCLYDLQERLGLMYMGFKVLYEVWLFKLCNPCHGAVVHELHVCNIVAKCYALHYVVWIDNVHESYVCHGLHALTWFVCELGCFMWVCYWCMWNVMLHVFTWWSTCSWLVVIDRNS